MQKCISVYSLLKLTLNFNQKYEIVFSQPLIIQLGLVSPTCVCWLEQIKANIIIGAGPESYNGLPV